MTEYLLLVKNRRFRQIILTGVFLFVLIGGWFWPLLGYFVPFCMLIGIGIGLFRGRKWCDWLCPRGSFYDTVIKPLSPQREIPQFFKKRNFRIAVLVLLLLILTSNLISGWPDPQKIGRFFIAMLTVTSVFGVIFGLLLHQRSWCYLCPVGTLTGSIGGRRYPLKIISRLCNECQLCNQACPMQIKPAQFKKEGAELVKNNDCLKCNLCVLVCPHRALTRDKAIPVDTSK